MALPASVAAADSATATATLQFEYRAIPVDPTSQSYFRLHGTGAERLLGLLADWRTCSDVRRALFKLRDDPSSEFNVRLSCERIAADLDACIRTCMARGLLEQRTV